MSPYDGTSIGLGTVEQSWSVTIFIILSMRVISLYREGKKTGCQISGLENTGQEEEGNIREKNEGGDKKLNLRQPIGHFVAKLKGPRLHVHANHSRNNLIGS